MISNITPKNTLFLSSYPLNPIRLNFTHKISLKEQIYNKQRIFRVNDLPKPSQKWAVPEFVWHGLNGQIIKKAHKKALNPAKKIVAKQTKNTPDTLNLSV